MRVSESVLFTARFAKVTEFAEEIFFFSAEPRNFSGIKGQKRKRYTHCCKKTETLLRIVRVSRAYTLGKQSYPGSNIKRRAVQFFYSPLIYDINEAQSVRRRARNCFPSLI